MCFKREKTYRFLGYYDTDFVGDKVQRKSTSGGFHFIGECLVSWTSKKQGIIALSIAKAKYISAPSYCSQLLWIKH